MDDKLFAEYIKSDGSYRKHLNLDERVTLSYWPELKGKEMEKIKNIAMEISKHIHTYPDNNIGIEVVYDRKFYPKSKDIKIHPLNDKYRINNVGPFNKSNGQGIRIKDINIGYIHSSFVYKGHDIIISYKKPLKY